jgi:hypothetical protein
MAVTATIPLQAAGAAEQERKRRQKPCQHTLLSDMQKKQDSNVLPL